MSVIFIALPAAIVLAGSAVLAFAWAAMSGQFDDLDTPCTRMTYDDDD